MIAELPGQVGSCPVNLVGGSGSVHRGEQAPGNGYVTGSGKADRDRGLGDERRDAFGSVRVGF